MKALIREGDDAHRYRRDHCRSQTSLGADAEGETNPVDRQQKYQGRDRVEITLAPSGKKKNGRRGAGGEDIQEAKSPCQRASVEVMCNASIAATGVDNIDQRSFIAARLDGVMRRWLWSVYDAAIVTLLALFSAGIVLTLSGFVRW